MRVLYLTSWDTACGIATYSANLIEQLEKMGINVEVFSDTKNFHSLVRLAKDTVADVIHIQHEFGISLATEGILSIVGKFRSMGKAVVLTEHTEDSIFSILLDGAVDACIVHNDKLNLSDKPTFSKWYKIPHGIPEINFDNPKYFYRKKYNIPEDAFVIGTCGFLSPERGTFIEKFLEYLIPFIKDHKEVYVNISTSSHRSDSDGTFAKLIRSTLTSMAEANGYHNRFYINSDFMETQEFRERLYTMDIGFSYSKSTIVSNSGAAADMISCNVPVIVNKAPHFSHISPYCIVEEDIEEMAKKLVDIYSTNTLEYWKKKTINAVKDLGYSKIAKKHIEVYNGVVKRAVRTQDKVFDKVKYDKKHLNKDDFIQIMCPNSIWQILLLWKKLKALVDDGYRFRFIVQHEGMMDVSILKFVLDGFSDIQFGEVGMGNDKRIVRVHSRSISQNVTLDLERWLEEGRGFDSVLNLSYSNDPYPMKLGDYADRRSHSLIPNKDVALINVSGLSMVAKALDMLKTSAKEGSSFKQLVIMASPLYEMYARELASKVKEANPKVVIEDTRTRWALCRRAKSVFTEWDDVAVFCLVNQIPAYYEITSNWQEDLIKLIGKDYNITRIDSKIYKFTMAG